MSTIHAATVCRVLQAADLKPHRVRAWKTTVWDEEAVARAVKFCGITSASSRCGSAAKGSWLWTKSPICKSSNGPRLPS